MRASDPSVRGASSEYRGPERRRPGRPWVDRPLAGRDGDTPARERASRRVSTGSHAGISRARSALHVAAGAAGWAIFAALWVWQLKVYVPAHWLGGILLLVAIAAAYSLLTPGWVWWNRNIYRRRHRRRSALEREVAMDRDTLGRRLLIAPEVLLNPAVVRVTVDADGTVKRYDVPPPVQLEPPAYDPLQIPLREASMA